MVPGGHGQWRKSGVTLAWSFLGGKPEGKHSVPKWGSKWTLSSCRKASSGQREVTILPTMWLLQLIHSCYPPQWHSELILDTKPIEFVSMDLYHKNQRVKSAYILLLVDHFSPYMQGSQTSNKGFTGENTFALFYVIKGKLERWL